MKTALSLIVIFSFAFCGCNQSPARVPATMPAASQAWSPLVGHWAGDAEIIVQWARQNRLPVTLDISVDGTVTGTVGDAKLVDGRFVSRRPNAGYRVHGRLEGDLIGAEHVRRDAVDILFDHASDHTLKGGLHSSGWDVGGADRMKLSAADMVLTRSEPTTASAGKP